MRGEKKIEKLYFNSPELFVDIRDNDIVLFALFKRPRFCFEPAVFHPWIAKVVRL